jgi:DNA-binding MarR family transcriptional regulator
MRGDEQTATGHLLWRVTMKWRAAVERAVAPLGLTHAQYVLLGSLYGLTANGVRPSQRELADHTGLEQVYVSKLARALEQSGFIERATHPGDPRAVQLRVTESGAEVIQHAVTVVHQLLESLTEPIGGLAGATNTRLRGILRTLLGDPLNEGGQDQMTQAVQPVTTFGQHLGLAQRAAQRALGGVLTREGFTFHEWIALELLNGKGGSLPRPELRDTLATTLDLDLATVDSLLGGLEARDVVRGAETIELTDSPDLTHLVAAVRELSRQLTGGIPAEDVATASRVLVAFRERAASLAPARG